MESASREPQQPESRQAHSSPQEESRAGVPVVGDADGPRLEAVTSASASASAGAGVSPGVLDAPGALDARVALDAVANSKALVAERMRRGPRWYNPVYGAACGLLVLAIGLPMPWFFVGVTVALITFGLLIRIYRERTGIVLGTGNPRPRGIYPWLVAVLGIGAGASYLDGHHGFPLGVPIVAVAVGVACWVLSRRYVAALFALLEGDGDPDTDGARAGGREGAGEARP